MPVGSANRAKGRKMRALLSPYKAPPFFDRRPSSLFGLQTLSELEQLYDTALRGGADKAVGLLGPQGLEGLCRGLGYMLLFNMDNDDGES